MRIVHSFSTGMAALHGGSKRYSAVWPTARHYLCMQVVSAHKAVEHYGAIDLITDKAGAAVLVDALQLPYRRVSVSLDAVDLPSRLWAAHKVAAIAECVRDGQPFWHIDGDVAFFARLPEWAERAGVLTQNVELAPECNVPHFYSKPKRELLESLPVVPEAWRRLKVDGAYNMGIVGGHDLDALHRYVADAERVLGTDNHEDWHALADTCGAYLHAYNVVVEQLTLYAAASHYEFGVTTLFDGFECYEPEAGEALGYFHALGGKHEQPTPGSLPDRVEQRCRRDYPDHYERLCHWLST